jgi:predicted kinase
VTAAVQLGRCHNVPVPDRIPGVLLTGTVGAGKTSVAVEIGELLQAAGLPYSVIDLDWLCWISPAPDRGQSVHDVLVEALGAVWPVHRAAGVQRLILARGMRDAVEIDSVRAAVPDVDVQVVQLAVDHDVVRRRLGERDTGAQLAQHLELLEQLDPGPLPGAHRVSNSADLRSCVEEVLRRLDWTI